MPEMLSKAIRMASIAHEGQLDKAGSPYILHPLRVMMMVGNNKALMTATVLHDIVEDTDWTLEMLRAEGFNRQIIDAVDAMTRRVYEDGSKEIYHQEFIPRLMKNQFACIVKMMDLTDNSTTWRLVHLPMETMRSFLKKYGKTKTALWEAYVGASMAEYGRVLSLRI